MIRDTSLLAFRQIEPTLQKREQDVIRWLAKINQPPTRNELAEASGIRLSSVAGRINHLVALGIVEELPSRPDKHTGRSAHPLRLAAVQREMDLAA